MDIQKLKENINKIKNLEIKKIELSSQIKRNKFNFGFEFVLFLIFIISLLTTHLISGAEDNFLDIYCVGGIIQLNCMYLFYLFEMESSKKFKELEKKKIITTCILIFILSPLTYTIVYLMSSLFSFMLFIVYDFVFLKSGLTDQELTSFFIYEYSMNVLIIVGILLTVITLIKTFFVAKKTGVFFKKEKVLDTNRKLNKITEEIELISNKIKNSISDIDELILLDMIFQKESFKDKNKIVMQKQNDLIESSNVETWNDYVFKETEKKVRQKNQKIIIHTN